jgi:hypothetical protein
LQRVTEARATAQIVTESFHRCGIQYRLKVLGAGTVFFKRLVKLGGFLRAKGFF